MPQLKAAVYPKSKNMRIIHIPTEASDTPLTSDEVLILELADELGRLGEENEQLRCQIAELKAVRPTWDSTLAMEIPCQHWGGEP